MAERVKPELRVVAVAGQRVSDPPGSELTVIEDVAEEAAPDNSFTAMIDKMGDGVEKGIRSGHKEGLIVTFGEDGSFAFELTDNVSLIQVVGVLDVLKADFIDDFRCSQVDPEEEEVDGAPPSA